MRFPISVWSSYYLEFEIEDAVKALQKADFHYTEMCIEHTESLVQRAQSVRGGIEQVGFQFRRFLDDSGFCIPQGHLTYDLGVCTENAITVLKKQLDLYASIGIRAAILHAGGGPKDLTEEEKFQSRLDGINRLADHIKGTGITLCLENLAPRPATHTVENLMRYINGVDNSAQMGICLDTGHLHLTNGLGYTNLSHADFIRQAGDRLKAMHITDNSGVSDDHLMPYSSRLGIDWKPIMKALREVNYQGLFNMEILGEVEAPLNIRNEKIKYLRALGEILVSDEFVMNT